MAEETKTVENAAPRRGRPARPEMRAAEPDVADIRAPQREEDSRARAAKRLAELRKHGGDDVDASDKYGIDPRMVPDGWSYEWKRKSLWGKEDPQYEVALTRGGWEPVPASRHPEMMPKGTFNTIERDGMVLMERPVELTQEARDKELRRARMQVRAKEEQLNDAPAGTFERANKDSSMAKVKKSYESMPIPKE